MTRTNPLDIDSLSSVDVVEMTQARDDFQRIIGQTVMVLAAVPRYSSISIQSLWKLLIEPLARDRVLIGAPGNPPGK
jgi:hypothetical protein